MTDSSHPSDPDAIDVRQLANSVRAVAFAVVIGLSYFNMLVVRSIGWFDQIFRDMLGGKPLPFMSQLMLDQRAIFLALAVLIPSAALAALLTRRVVVGLYILSAAALVALLESGLVFHAMFSPLFMIIQQMGAGSGSDI